MSVENFMRPQANGSAQYQPSLTATLTLAAWLARDISEPDYLLGELLSTTSRMLLVGPTGLGKTMFGLAVGLGSASGKGFLHWTAKRRARVLYVDGEMGRRQMKRRLQDAVRRAGTKPDSLIILSKEDFEDMPPLNSPGGQKWFDAFMAQHGPFDFVIFDNIQALLVGDMKDEEQWSKLLPWVRSLTRRSIGQLWFHHTGHDETKRSKAREWQMDTVAIMERVESEHDIAFALKFTKARERTPENRADFEPVTMTLCGDEWQRGEATSAKKASPTGKNKVALDALEKAISVAGAVPPTCADISDDTPTVSFELWQRYAFQMGISDAEATKAKNQTFKRAVEALQGRNIIGRWNDQCWLV
jgi:AAA domain